MKKGLVLEGGGLRSLFSAGVMDVMMENAVSFDGIIGVSAGACFGCNYKSGQIGRSLRYNLRFAGDPRYMSWHSLLKEGNLVSAEFAYHTLPTKLDVFDFEEFANNHTEYYVVCCDIEKAEPVYHKIDEMDYEALEWMRASASMPLVSRPVKLGGTKLLDGGMADSIPLEAFNNMGYKRNIVILTQPSDYAKHPSRLNKAFDIFMHGYPQVYQLMKNRYKMYNGQLEYVRRQEACGSALVICPAAPLEISRTSSDKKQMQAVYDQGRAAGVANIEKIKEFLSFS